MASQLWGGYLWGVLMILALVPARLDALYCYQCLSLTCPEELSKEDCEDVRVFVSREVRGYYSIPERQVLQVCPDVKDESEWREMQSDDERRCNKGNACSAGHIQVKTYRADGDADGDKKQKPPLISHATIIGCPNPTLVKNFNEAQYRTQCSLIQKNGTGTRTDIFHRMELEHCKKPQNWCNKEEFCINEEHSVVKEFANGSSYTRFDYGLVIGIIAFIVVIFAAIIGASLCSFPVGRPSNFPKSGGGENSDLIGVSPSGASSPIEATGEGHS